MLSKILSNSHSFELHTERRTGLRYERHINQRAGKSYFSLFFLVIPLPQAQQEVCKYVFIFWHFAIPREVVYVNDVKVISCSILTDNIQVE